MCILQWALHLRPTTRPSVWANGGIVWSSYVCHNGPYGFVRVTLVHVWSSYFHVTGSQLQCSDMFSGREGSITLRRWFTEQSQTNTFRRQYTDVDHRSSSYSLLRCFDFFSAGSVTFCCLSLFVKRSLLQIVMHERFSNLYPGRRLWLREHVFDNTAPLGTTARQSRPFVTMHLVPFSSFQVTAPPSLNRLLSFPLSQLFPSLPPPTHFWPLPSPLLVELKCVWLKN